MVSLKTLNASAAITHYGLAIGFGAYFNYINNKYPGTDVRGLELSVRDHALNLTNNTGGSDVWISKETRVVQIKTIQTLLIAFFIITGTFHLFYYGTDDKGGYSGRIENNGLKNKYNQIIAGKNNYFRWIEYSITSTMMLYVIALSSGVKDTNIYAMLLANNVAMIAMGQLIEENLRDGKPWWIPMVVSFALLLSEFAIIARSFWARLKEVNDFLKQNPSNDSKGIPSWLNAMIIVLFLLFSCFGFISLYGAYSGVKYESIEKLYLIFSFVAKATLGFFLAYGMGQRQSSSS